MFSVLTVDDEREVCIALSEIITSNGYQVCAYPSCGCPRWNRAPAIPDVDAHIFCLLRGKCSTKVTE